MSHRKRHDFPVTAALGYAFLIVVFGFAVWFIYGYTRSAVRLSDVESATTVRWDATSRLVHSIFEVENMERAVCLGDIGLWDDYEQALSRTQAYADSLALLMSDSVQRSRVDSLKMLLASKRENTLMLVDIIRADGAAHAYEVRAERLLSGRDSVVVHSDMSRNREEKLVTYVINKTARHFSTVLPMSSDGPGRTLQQSPYRHVPPVRTRCGKPSMSATQWQRCSQEWDARRSACAAHATAVSGSGRVCCN